MIFKMSFISYFQFRNQYDNDVTVWSPQVNKFVVESIVHVTFKKDVVVCLLRVQLSNVLLSFFYMSISQ